MDEKYSMSWYFDRGLEKKALLLDASNLDWFEFPLFSNIRNEIYRTLEDPSEDMDWGYSYPGGKTKFRELIAEHESNIEGVNFAKQDVIIGGNGVTGVLNFVAQFLKKKSLVLNKKSILYPVPAYAGLLKSIQYYDLNAIKIEMKRENNYCLTYDDVVKNYNEDVLAILITNPGNPSCCYIENENFCNILNFCKEKGIYIIIDAIFEESPGSENKYSKSFGLIDCYDKLIKIKGFSKDIPQLSDLRLGWSITKNVDFNNEMLELGEITNYSNSTFLEALGMAEMETRVAIDNRVNNDKISTYLSEKEIYHYKIKESIDKLVNIVNDSCVFDDVIIPEAGNILFIKVNEKCCHKRMINTSHDLFVYILEKANILVTPGHVFGLNPSQMWFRITISRSIEQLICGIKKIEEILGDIDE
nr:pyridoxal phosphate-dependent aminotransferase [Bacilli bacterium]